MQIGLKKIKLKSETKLDLNDFQFVVFKFYY